MSNDHYDNLAAELTLPKDEDNFSNRSESATDYVGGYSVNSSPSYSNEDVELMATQSKMLKSIEDVVLKVPHYPSRQKTFDVLQKWEGFVSAVDFENEIFTARITDITNEKNPDEEVEISFDEISESDISLIEDGAIFSWVIGYQKEEHGQNTRSSAIRFRRLPAWSQKELVKAKERASELSKYFSLSPERKSSNS